MLNITIPEKEYFDEDKGVFYQTKKQTLQLEHSLVSLSKWESKWKKPFLTKDPKTREKTLDYIRCMTLTQNVDPSVYAYIPPEVIKQINDYISDPMTATTFKQNSNEKRNRDIVTAEIIYWQMIALEIPMECQKWHLNRLLTLIRVCSIKNTPSKKMSKKDVLRNNSALNEARKKKLHTSG